MNPPSIHFVRIERECAHNRELRAAHGCRGNPRGLLLDFHVIIDGEHRATFSKTGYRPGYTLDGLTPNRHGGSCLFDSEEKTADAKSQAQFESVVREWLMRGLIPTLADYAKQREAIAARKFAESEKQRVAALMDENLANARLLYASVTRPNNTLTGDAARLALRLGQVLEWIDAR